MFLHSKSKSSCGHNLTWTCCTSGQHSVLPASASPCKVVDSIVFFPQPQNMTFTHNIYHVVPSPCDF